MIRQRQDRSSTKISNSRGAHWQRAAALDLKDAAALKGGAEHAQRSRPPDECQVLACSRMHLGSGAELLEQSEQVPIRELFHYLLIL